MTSPTTRPARSANVLARIVLLSFALAAAVTIVGPISNPEPVQASTASYMEGLIVKWVNNARANRGIPKLTVGTKLTTLAGDRAATLARNNELGHPKCLGCLLSSRDISWRTCGEVVAMTSAKWGYDAARSLYLLWKGSSGHWALLMSRDFKRFGVGVAYRSSNRTSWGAIVLAG